MNGCAPFEYDPLLTWEEIKLRYNLPYCREHILGKGRMVAKGQFPKPIRLGHGSGSRLAWRRSWIEAWIRSRPEYEPPQEEDDSALE